MQAHLAAHATDIALPPPHVVRIEALMLGAVRRHLQDHNPVLTHQQADFLCAPWVHFFTHSALHRLEGFGAPARAGVDQGRSGPPGDTLAFMEFFRTPAYREHLDRTLAGDPGRVECRTSLHVLTPRLRGGGTLAFMSCLPRGFRYMLPLLSAGRIRFLDNKPQSVEVATDSARRASLSRQVQQALSTDLPHAAAWLGARAGELFPKSLLENLAPNLQAKGTLPPWRTLFSADGWQIIDDWKVYALAQKISHGTSWTGAPNAISHGSLAVFWQREFEITHMDRYLTWGWSRPGAAHVLPFYSPHFAGQRQCQPARAAAGHGLLVTSAARPQHLLEYPYTPERFEHYLRTQLDLADRAQRLTGQPVTIRTRPRDLGWDLQSMVQSLGNDEVTLEFQSGKFAERLRQSRVHICDNCSTTIAESLWANHPTLILIDGGYFQLHPDARREYAGLETAGVFHTSTASLLRQLESIQTNVTGWWEQAATQQAVREFLHRQGRDGSALSDWRRALLAPSLPPPTH